MDGAARDFSFLTAEAFLRTDQREFGDAWRYELVDGRIVAQPAPAPDHGTILAGLMAALGRRLRGHKEGCRPEAGSGAAPKDRQRPDARIPDALIRCGNLPRVLFEIVSPSEIAARTYRLTASGDWAFDAIGGADAVLHLPSVGLSVPLSEVYEFTDLAAD